MAKSVQIKNVKTVIKQARGVFKTVKQNRKMLGQIGEYSILRISMEARRGRSLENDKLKSLPQLKESSKSIRKAIRKTMPEVVDATFFKPNKSNVTLTGQLLKSFGFKVKKAVRSTKLLFEFKGRRSKIAGLSRGKGKQLSTNSAVYDDLRKRGFGFVGMDEKGSKQIKKLVLAEFRRTIKKIF